MGCVGGVAVVAGAARIPLTPFFPGAGCPMGVAWEKGEPIPEQHSILSSSPLPALVEGPAVRAAPSTLLNTFLVTTCEPLGDAINNDC